MQQLIKNIRPRAGTMLSIRRAGTRFARPSQTYNKRVQVPIALPLRSRLKLGRVLRLGILPLGEAELSAHPRSAL